MSALGDLLQALPIAAKIKAHHPDVIIHWVVKRAFLPIVQAVSWVDRAICFEEPILDHYDYIFDLQGNIKSLLARFFVKANCVVGFSRKGLAEWPAFLGLTDRIEFNASLEERDRLASLILPYFSLGEGKRLFDHLPKLPKKEKYSVMIGMHSRWPSKKISGSLWKKICLDLANKVPLCLHIPFTTDKEKKESFEVFDDLGIETLYYDNRSILDLYQEIESMHSFIGVDSALLHLAQTTETPSLGLFGPSNGKIYHPNRQGRIFVQASCPFGYQFDKRCKKLRSCPAPCMQNPSFKTGLIDKVHQLLDLST